MADDFGASTGAGNLGTLTVGGSASGSLETGGDRDWFRITLVAGQSYIFNMDGGTLPDPFLILRDQNGVSILGNDDVVSNVNFNSQIRFTSTVSGTYFLDAFSSDGEQTGTGTYTVRAAIDPNPPASNDDFTAQAGSPNVGAVAVGGSATGNLETPGDSDWFSVTLTAGTSYVFRQNGGTLVDPLLRLRDANGVVIAANDDGGGGSNPLINYTAVTSGTYYLEANTADAGQPAGTGTYTVSAAVNGSPPPAPVDDFGSQVGAGNLGSVAVGSSSAGVINFDGDHDWFAVTLSAGSTYRFRQEAGSLDDPRFTLRDSVGGSLVGNDDFGGELDAQLDFTATTSGTYYIDANSSLATDTGTYTVRATLIYGAPVIATNTGSTVAEGATDVVTSGELSTTDPDSAAAAITYTLTSLASNGTLTRNGTALSLNGTFTQADINSNFIAYTHDGGEATSASFGFSVTDGTTSLTGQTFAFTVTPINDAPVIGNLEGDVLTFTRGQSGQVLDRGAAATITDADSANFGGGSLDVVVSNALAGDTLEFTFTAGFTITNPSANTVQLNYLGGQIGTLTINSAANWTFDFNTNATPALVSGLISTVYFSSTSFVTARATSCGR